MKELLIGLLITVSSIACTSTSEKNNADAKGNAAVVTTELDTTVIYWETDVDTVKADSSIRVGNEYYDLNIATYSLNDSSISWVNDLNRDLIYKDVYHNRATIISLSGKNDTIIAAVLDKSEFEDLLDSEFYNRCYLKNIEYDFIRSNRIYFKVTLIVPDTDWQMDGMMAIFYKTSKKGVVDSWLDKKP